MILFINIYLSNEFKLIVVMRIDEIDINDIEKTIKIIKIDIIIKRIDIIIKIEMFE